ncbi:tetratricopeptide repeat protein [Corticibacter populi]|nr:hypothetical protein [Corticibacter populi]
MLEQATQALAAQQYERVENFANRLVASEFPDIAQSGLRLMGLLYFHQQQFDLALPFFEKLAPQTGNASDWFNVVTAATLAGDQPRAEAAFEQATKAHESGGEAQALSVPMMHHLYACALRDKGGYAQAFEHVQVLRAIYEKLHNTDPRFLALRNLPQLDAVLEMMVDVLAHSGDIPEAVEWLQTFGSQLDANGQQLALQAIARLQAVTKAAPPTRGAAAAGPAPEQEQQQPQSS